MNEPPENNDGKYAKDRLTRHRFPPNAQLMSDNFLRTPKAHLS